MKSHSNVESSVYADNVESNGQFTLEHDMNVALGVDMADVPYSEMPTGTYVEVPYIEVAYDEVVPHAEVKPIVTQSNDEEPFTDKPFVCKVVCYKRFATRSEMELHLETHEKPFACTNCEESFVHDKDKSLYRSCQKKSMIIFKNPYICFCSILCTLLNEHIIIYYYQYCYSLI